MFFRSFRSFDRGKSPLRPKEYAFRPLTEEELQRESKTAVVDVRGWMKFGEGHFPGSWNIGLENTDFISSVGIFVERTDRIVLVSEDYRQAHQARFELLKGGFRRVKGFAEAQRLTCLHRITQLAVADLKSTLSRGGKPEILDVRSPEEWGLTRISRSTNIPLEVLPVRFAELSKSKPLVLICQDGYRSAVASSWLQSKGFESVHHLVGGMKRYGAVPLSQIVPALSFATRASLLE
jgi:hydroxyacylglutathione hydrolase